MTLLLDFGLITAQRPAHDTRAWEELYADTLATAVGAERAGFDGIWVSEHHFTDDGYAGAMFPLLAALAASTERVMLGTNVILATLYHPLRLAEDAALVDIVSGNRLVLGMAIGYRDAEFEALGVPKRERVPRIVEIVDVCRKAWTGAPFSASGPVVQVEDLVVRPAPRRPIPIWLGGWVDKGIERAARLGDGYVAPTGALDDMRQRVAVLDAACDRIGRSARLPLSNLVSVMVTPDGRPTRAMRDGVWHMMDSYREWYSSSTDEGGGHEVGALLQQVKAMNPEIPPGVVVGTPRQVVDLLAPLATAFSRERDHRLCLRFDYPGMSRAEVMDHLGLFAREVAPALRSA